LEGDPPYVNLKCDPERAIELREEYEDILLGWHMNKIIWQLFYTVKRKREDLLAFPIFILLNPGNLLP